MKAIVWKSWLLVAVAMLVLWGGRMTVCAQEDQNEHRVMVRMERLEQQVRRLSEQQSHLASPVESGMAPRLQQAPVCPLPGNPVPCAPMAQKFHRRCCPLIGILLVVLAVIHIMLAVWVFTDIRKRGEGSGIFIVLALLAGIPGTILYALVRLGDRLGEKKA